MRSVVSRSPDGRTWDVTVDRIHLPQFAASQFEPSDHASDVLSGLIAYLVLAPFFWFIVPLLRAVASLPFALARPLFLTTRWVEAESRGHGPVVITWETTREHATTVALEIATRLERGYENITPPNARLISMTEPPGFADLDA